MTATKTLTYGATAPTNPNDGDHWLKPVGSNTVYEYRWNTTLAQWEMHSAGVPPGGTQGQILTKTTAADYDNQWTTPTSGTPADATTTSKGVVQLAGDLAGTAAAPQIAAGVIVDTDIAAANKDGVAATPSLRTLGTGGQQAAAGNDTRIINAIPNTQISQPGGVAPLDSNGHLPAANRDMYSSTPPPNPLNGDIWIFPADTTNGILWRFRYNGITGSAYKWEYIGGSPIYSTVDTAESTASSTDVDLATIGPSVTVPRPGDYLIDTRVLAQLNGTTGSDAVCNIYANAALLTAAGAAAGTPIGHYAALASLGKTLGRAANDVLKVKYSNTGGQSTLFFNRRIAVTPIRVS